MTLALLWEEYRTGAPDRFCYSWFYGLYQAWVGRLKPMLRQVHVAGERMFADFAGQIMEAFAGATREARRAEVFVFQCRVRPATSTPKRCGASRCRTGSRPSARLRSGFRDLFGIPRSYRLERRHCPARLAQRSVARYVAQCLPRSTPKTVEPSPSST
jgi:hypothetical protein